MIDTGAPDSLSGSQWLDCFIDSTLKPRGLDEDIKVRDKTQRYTGVGHGEQRSDTQVLLPIGVGGDVMAFKHQVIEGDGSHFLPSWG